MFGLSLFEWLALAALVVIGVAVIARRNPKVQAKLLDTLPDAGDQALLQLQQHIPTKADLRDRVRAALDLADEEAINQAKAYLEKRGYSVIKPAP